MGKKAMKVSKIGKGKLAKFSAWVGRKEKTVGGLKKSDLIKNKNGKVVSKKRHAFAKKHGRIQKWTGAVVKARKALGIKGFAVIGGKTKQGQTLLSKVRSF